MYDVVEAAFYATEAKCIMLKMNATSTSRVTISEMTGFPGVDRR